MSPLLRLAATNEEVHAPEASCPTDLIVAGLLEYIGEKPGSNPVVDRYRITAKGLAVYRNEFEERPSNA